MAIKTKDELINNIKTFIGENDSDEALALLEDVSDTFADFETKTADSTDWKSKYEENDKAWRTKYKERFTAPVKQTDDSDNGDSNNDDDIEDDKPLTFENLFENK